MHTLTPLLLWPFTLAADPAPDFAREVRPILAQHCFKCHGPDPKTRKAKLRLDRREDAVRSAVVPGKPDESELVARILSDDESAVMPPPEAKKPLTAKQKDTLKRWVAAGAEYRPHWAFEPVKRPPVPASRDREGAAEAVNPIDAFVRARLEKEGLSPNPPADKHTLVRRVYLDLIGLPPTPAEADAFVNDASPDAYERLVDKLLASPHYGERWARRWLDLARYADTNGYEKDRPRSIWPYRDWVIRALNADLPFDRFTVEQLAGDMLPNPTPDQIAATGFHRNTMTNEEGGIDPLEFRFYAMVDRVNTTGTAWLGLTLGCVQCHTHKYDPIPQADYYRVLACLNNADEPEYEVPDPAVARRRAEIEATIRKREADLPAKASAAGFAWWLGRERARAVRWAVIRPTKTEAGLTKLHSLDDGSLLATGDPTKADVYELTFAGLPAGVTAVRLEALPHESLPAHGPGRAYYEGPKGDFLLSDFRLSLDGRPVAFADASESYAKLGLIAKASSALMALDDNLQTGWAASGREGRPSHAIFNTKEPLPVAKTARLKLTFERHYAASLGRFRVSVTTDPRSIKARDIPAEVEDLLLLPDEKLTADQWAALRRQYVATAPESKAARDEVEKLRASRPPFPTTLALKERPAGHPRRTFVHTRGEFLRPAEEVRPGTLSFLPPAPGPMNRLAFARWLVAKDNPLTPRVAANRAWAAFFGRGIVRTTEDFGFQGDPPTHPDLLDRLAADFRDTGWSQKRLHKLIVMSATYRQSSRVTPEQLAIDPENKLLARGPRVRLEAEMIRDVALAASGLLSRKVGGPSVFPPQPPGVTTEGAYRAFEWKVSPGEDRYRRGLYTFAKRTTPYAMFATFDGPSGEACVARREVSNTPLQALTMLNDAVLTEPAQSLGRAAAKEVGTAAAKADLIVRRCLTRPATADEAKLLAAFYEAQRAKFAADAKAAEAFAGPGEDDAAERAAWTAVARAVLNLDEFVTKE